MGSAVKGLRNARVRHIGNLRMDRWLWSVRTELPTSSSVPFKITEQMKLLTNLYTALYISFLLKFRRWSDSNCSVCLEQFICKIKTQCMLIVPFVVNWRHNLFSQPLPDRYFSNIGPTHEWSFFLATYGAVKFYCDWLIDWTTPVFHNSFISRLTVRFSDTSLT